MAAEIALGCELLVEAEETVMGYARSESPDVAGLKKAYMATKEAFEAIPGEVKRRLS